MEEEKIKAVRKLMDLLAAALSNPKWVSLPDGTTFCNFFCQQVAHGFDCADLDNEDGTPRMAVSEGHFLERMIQDATLLNLPCKWSLASPEKAVAHAKNGGLGLTWSPPPPGEAHGHEAVVAPEDMDYSVSYGCDVPMIASIARYPRINRIMRVSEAYKANNRPIYLLYNADKDA